MVGDSVAVYTLQESCLPLGMIDWTVYTAHTVFVKKGAKILLMSDGIAEAENLTGEFFGQKE
jgi:serine phosphatase RsbU (regulator of sigma subunit)